MTSIALWTAFLKSLDQQLLLTEQLMLQTPDTDQLAANYDEKLKQMEKAKEKDFEMGQNSEKELDRMSKQIQSGDEQNLELSESLRAINLPPANSNKQKLRRNL
jgi:hypothetical protein